MKFKGKYLYFLFLITKILNRILSVDKFGKIPNLESLLKSNA